MCKTSFLICFIAVSYLIKESSSFCKPFDKDSGLANKCGYSATVNFTHPSQYQTAIKSANYIFTRFKSCSEYATVIACSVSIPRCERNIPGPYLPCKRVCDEFNRQCSDQILKYGMEWIIGMCQLLPEKDDPNTKLGYLGRCFEPPNFKTSVIKSSPLKCNNLIIPACQNAGYSKTILSEESQKTYFSWASDQLEKKNKNPACEVPQKKLFCMSNFLPCVDNKVASYCRSKCERYFEMNCTSPYKPSGYIMCMDFPKGSNVNDSCTHSDWPKAMNWPQVRMKQQIDTSTTTRRPDGAGIIDGSGTTSSPVIFSTRPTSKEIKAKKTDSISNVEGATKPKMGAVVGGAIAFLVVIVVVIVVAVCIHRNRQRTSRTSRQGIERKDRTTNKLLA